MYLEKINGPEDIKKLNIEELKILAGETRDALINKISNAGGHNGPNLGMVEMTVALHYVFNSPDDKIVFDVSHQCYPHKILTGRKEAFLDYNHFNDVTGYTNPLESKHDIFTVGHTSTSISLALGLAKGRDLNNKKENIIAVIGDGSLSGGEALEGLDYAGEYNKNLIIIVNDNDQSIADNHGGIYKTLKKLRDTNGNAEDNLFKSFGLEYIYLDDGHDIEKLESMLKISKKIQGPVLLHIVTKKGKGYKIAEENPDKFHGTGPFDIETGKPKKEKSKDYSAVFGEKLIELAKKNKKIVAITAAMRDGTGLRKFAEEFPDRFFDVGIAEQHALGLAAGMAKEGVIPVVPIYSSFYQRGYDQVIHDIAAQNLPVVMCVDRAGVVGQDRSNTSRFTRYGIF